MSSSPNLPMMASSSNSQGADNMMKNRREASSHGSSRNGSSLLPVNGDGELHDLLATYSMTSNIKQQNL